MIRELRRSRSVAFTRRGTAMNSRAPWPNSMTSTFSSNLARSISKAARDVELRHRGAAHASHGLAREGARHASHGEGREAEARADREHAVRAQRDAPWTDDERALRAQADEPRFVSGRLHAHRPDPAFWIM